jgi:mRNA interferase RelE/StbE
MKYTVIISRPARKIIDRLETDLFNRIVKKLKNLEDNPWPSGAEKLTGEANVYRVRVGDWRIVYQIRDRELIVLVVKVVHRREVYR